MSSNETPSERDLREELEAAEALLAQEISQAGSPHVVTRRIREAQEAMRGTRESREATGALQAQETAPAGPSNPVNRQMREAMLTAQAANEHAQMVAWDNPDLVLNRATVLLACICLVRFHRPMWPNQEIVEYIQPSFPEFEIRPRDVYSLFSATCRNRPRWVRVMRRVEDAQERANAEVILRALPEGRLARLPQLPLEFYRRRRDGIRYLQDLVNVRDGERG